ncbi:hypothetical protein BG011_008978 [Mortierella polycephala]|uniref:F-box domain-containing protein n=1 Tax=Mortierella polycephala TaxID=41804 RepID=A0A9P6PM14_9FUNG|nr:hypothetical protein BG011_008978 [Mortierella polycephala]
MALQSSNAPAPLVVSSASVMRRIPIEIIEAIGHFLDGPTAYSAIQVCHQWIIGFTTRKKLRNRPTIFPLLRSKTTSGLLSILQCCTHLTSLLIHKRRARLSDLKLLDDLLQLQSLRRLELNIHGDCDLALKAIEEMFPLFEQLDELVLAGSAFSIREYDSEDEDASTTTELETPRPWKLSRLSISPAAMMLLRHCPDLKTLELRQLDTWQEYESETYQSIRPIMVCTKLAELDLYLSNEQRDQSDVIETLSSFNQLRSLIFNPQSIEQISFLNTRLSNGGDGNDNSNGDLVLPLLEHLQLHPDCTQNDSFGINNALRDIFKTRPRLKSFALYKYPIYAADIFAKRGMEDQDGWACLDLERFYIHALILQEESPSTMIYRQLGLLSRLKHVSITCTEIKHGANSGIDLLVGASGLESLMLMDIRNPSWTKEEVFRVLQMFPKLSQLHVEPDSKATVLACAKELGRDISIGPGMGSFN